MPFSASDYFQQLLPSQAERARKRFFGQLGDLDPVAGQPAPQKQKGPILKLPGTVQPRTDGQLPQQTQQTERNQPNLRIPQTFPQGSIYTPQQQGMGGMDMFDRFKSPFPPNYPQQGRQPMDERLPDGRSVYDLLRGAPSGTPAGGPQSTMPQAPLKAHHGFWDRLKSIGEGFLVNAGQYSATHPGASAGEVLAAGGVGGIVGGVKPGKIDQQIFNQKSAREMARRAQEAEIQRVEAEARRAGMPPLEKPPEVREAGGAIVERQPDGTWKPVYTPPERPEKPIKKGVHVVGGRLVDDEGKVIYEAPEKPGKAGGLSPYQTQQLRRRETERQGKLDAATNEVQRLTAEEAEAAKRKDAAYEALHNITMNPNAPKEDVAAAQAAADKAQAYYASFADKKREAQGRIEQYRTAEPTEQAPSLKGRTISKANFERYKKDHGEQAAQELLNSGVSIR